MGQKRIKPYRKAPLKALYPQGWPSNLRAVLYLNERKERDDNSAFNEGSPLEAGTMIYGTTEMSNYG